MLVIYGNNPYDLAIAISIITIAPFLMLYAKKIIIKKFSPFVLQTETYIDDILLGIFASTKSFFLFFLSLYIGDNFLTLPEKLAKILSHLIFISFLLQIGLWVDKGITLGISEYQKKQRDTNPSILGVTATLSFLTRLILWIIITLFIIENLGFNITTLLASLGIGGIAIALATQNILSDIFASLSIVLDKPFIIGDFIIINDAMGTVEYIGLKTTRIRSLSGEEIIFSNANLLKERIHNYKRMHERRIVFNLDVVYQIKKEQLANIPDIIKEIILKQPNIRFDRAHFKEYSDSSLKFEIVYYINSPDYNIYMDIQQAINIEIFERFAQENIGFSYPTRTLHLVNT